MTDVIDVVATRPVTIGGVSYAPGDPVDVSKISMWKIRQLLDQRVLRPAEPIVLPDLENSRE